MESYDVLKKIVPLLDFPEKFLDIEGYLMANSNLPGPRGNLTLAFKFSECFEKEAVSKELLELLITWANISEKDGPTNHPKEYLTFCGIISLGAHYCYAQEDTKKLIMNQFKGAMNDKRWRAREGAAMGLQKIAEGDFGTIRKYFSLWHKDAGYIEKRALVATLAHPPILEREEIARFSLELSEGVLKDVLAAGKEERKSEDFKILSKGLQYALSVFVAYLPGEGFGLLRKYAGTHDSEMKKIIKSNLGKSRLTKKYPQEVEEVFDMIKP